MLPRLQPLAGVTHRAEPTREPSEALRISRIRQLWGLWSDIGEISVGGLRSTFGIEDIATEARCGPAESGGTGSSEGSSPDPLRTYLYP